MAHIWLLLALILPTIRTQYAERGALHRSLSGYMAKHPHFRMLYVDAPRYFVSPWSSCKWHVEVWSLGDYGRRLALMNTIPGNCEKASAQSWNGTFPCVLVRESNATNCTGPPPQWARNYKWSVGDYGNKPVVSWKGDFVDAPTIRIDNAVPFDGGLNCESLSGLALARAVQVTGIYKGEAAVSCGIVGRMFRVLLKGGGVDFSLKVNAKGANGTRLDLSTRMLWNATVVDDSGALVLSAEGRTPVSYTARLLGADRVKLQGTKRLVHIRSSAGEPRLCAASRMASACAVMKSESENDLRGLGNVTGFNVRYLAVLRKPRYVVVTGSVLGTRGVLEGTYYASALDKKEAGWTELPLTVYDLCAGALYLYADCGRELKVHRVPRVGPYKGKAEYYPFP